MQINATEGEKTCNSIASDLTESNHQSLYQKLDANGIIAHVLSAFDKDRFTTQEYQTFKQRLDSFIHNKIILRSDKVRWDMVSGHVDNDRYLCVVRSSLLGNGVSYVEFELQNIDSSIRIIDWYDMVREIRISDMLIELFKDIYEMTEAHLMAMPYQREMIVNQQKRYFDFITSFRSADFERIFTSYSKLPERFKNKPLYTLSLLNFATSMNGNHYYDVLRTLAERFGNSGRYEFLLIDLYLLDHEYDKAIEAIGRFKKRIGADPLLELLLAEVENMRGNKDAFYGFCLQLLNNNPKYLDTYWFVFEQLIADHLYEDAVLVLEVLSGLFQYTFYDNAFESDIKYREFSNSTVFKTWKAEQG